MSTKFIKSLVKRLLIVLIFGTWIVFAQLLCNVIGILMTFLSLPFILISSLKEEGSIDWFVDVYKEVVAEPFFYVWEDSELVHTVHNAIIGKEYING